MKRKKLDEKDREKIVTILRNGPRKYGIQRTRWHKKAFRMVVEKETGIARKSVDRILEEMGIQWERKIRTAQKEEMQTVLDLTRAGDSVEEISGKTGLEKWVVEDLFRTALYAERRAKRKEGKKWTGLVRRHRRKGIVLVDPKLLKLALETYYRPPMTLGIRQWSWTEETFKSALGDIKERKNKENEFDRLLDALEERYGIRFEEEVHPMSKIEYEAFWSVWKKT